MVDLHCHSKFSDGTDTVDKIVDKWIDLNLKFVSITDHDTIGGIQYLFSNDALMQKLKINGICCIKGIEFSCIDDNDKIHILAYNYDDQNLAFNEAICEGKARRLKKFIARADKLKETYGIEFDDDSYQKMLDSDYMGKPIMARQLVKDGKFKDMWEAYNCLNSLNISDSDTRIDASLAMHGIVDAGGIAVWAHPLGGLGEPRISYNDVERIIQKLKPLGLKGLECYYSLYTEEEIEKLISIAKKYDLAVSAGSDYHGKNKKTGLKELTKGKVLDLSVDKVTLIDMINKNA
ncbi:MAG: PHP domain-containing protein [Clostridiales bacterium]|nr:PHP domain-containing protein [Clostridiales bacterium]